MVLASARRGRASALVPVLALLLAAAPLLSAVRPARAAATFVVTTTGDQSDNNLADDRCDASPGPGFPCTLRAAIQEGNATPGHDLIHFGIAGSGVKTIRPTTPLPTIEQRTTLDGYTQPGSRPNTLPDPTKGTDAVLRIELDGSNAPFDPNGLTIAGTNVLVRGLVVNGFGDAVEVVGGATGVRIAGCFLGPDPSGTAKGGTGGLGNGFGVFVDGGAGTQVGGPTPAARNLISGNAFTGVLLQTAGARVLGNLIGTDKSGAAPLGNGAHGVQNFAPGVHVGGATAAHANVIAFNGSNGGDGVAVSGGTGTRVLRNSVFANGDLGIDLGNDGVTPNDPLDADDGPNTLQNFPVIAEATSTGVTGTLHSTPNQAFALRLFSNPGSGDEGKAFEDGPLVVHTDADGNAGFAFTPDPPIPAGRSVTATATNQGGSTSEFSFPAVPVAAG